AAAASGALAAVPERGGSALLSSVAGTLVRAYTAMGRMDEAAGVLSRPVPAPLTSSVHGLAYLRARGVHALATSRFHAALGDFLDVGRRLKGWSLDQPRVLPWRVDVAAALLRLGETRQAERFLKDQMATQDALDPWLRGMTLRLRAELAEPKERQELLARGVDELRRTGDRYHLAVALADFSEALHAAGEPARAGMVGRRAWHLAHECGAYTLCERILPGHTQDAGGPGDNGQLSSADLVATLSESEKRVAMLAVYGHTNREIAQKLYITVSTVEQHLTRAYRKLNIAGRQELPADLQLSAVDFA
ncbi:helix-turn-helix transcriptional regulator, partial [Streptomyces sp. NPDC051940]|uniref:helix-turn-helix transcriptional regulator n=1 Tax=Streptomyces sp. NPDC051940 TaxID=3155675 RepID=UPI0034281832